jgi:hypothetical protein
MSDALASDPYATAKANLRDTIKWLATSLAGLGAAVLAGASINGLAALKGPTLGVAAVLGVIGLLLILVAVGVLLSLLTAKVFYFSQLVQPRDEVAREINDNADDILPPPLRTIAELAEYRQRAWEDLSRAQPGTDDYRDASDRWGTANDSVSRITNLAQFLSLRHDFANCKWRLFWLAGFIIVVLGLYVFVVGGKSGLDEERKVVFKPGNGWSDAAASLASSCGAEPLNGAMLSKKMFDGWVTIRLAEPGKCSGLELSVPASLVQMTGPRT